MSFLYLTKKEVKNTLSIGIPLIASQLIYASSGFIGTAMVARLGQDALAASVLVQSIWITLSVLFFGILNSVGVLVAHQYGAKNYDQIGKIMGQAQLLGVVTTLVIVLILFSMPWFLRLSDQPAHVLNLAKEYMYAMTLTVPGLVVLIILEQFLIGINRSKLVLRMSFLIVPIEIPLIYALIFGKFGLPECGIAGVGYGFAITYTISGLGLMWYLLKSKQYRVFNIFKGINKIDLPYWREFILIGLPMGFMYTIELSTFAVGALWIGHFGTTFLAAHQIIFQYIGLTTTLVFAMSQAVTVRVGHAVGELNLQEVYYASYVGMFLNFIYILFISAGFYFTPEFFLRLDIDIYQPDNAQLVKDTSVLFAIISLFLIVENFRIIGFGALRGIKDTSFAMYTSLVGFWIIGLGSAYLFSFIWHFGGAGIWWGITLGVTISAVMLFARLHWLLRKLDVPTLEKISQIQ